MPDLSVLGPSLAVLLLTAVLLWFALGTQRNIRRGNDILRWLQGGLPLLGRRTTLRWLGSSAVVLSIVEPRRPFREASVVVVLEPRDVGVLWAWARARRRRDFLILRGRLDRPPAFEAEAGTAEGWTGTDRLAKLDPHAWERTEWEDVGVQVAHTATTDLAAVRTAWEVFAARSAGVWRISVRRDPPHLEVHVVPPALASETAEPLFQAFHDLAAAAR